MPCGCARRDSSNAYFHRSTLNHVWKGQASKRPSTRLRVLARNFARALHHHHPLQERRAQGRPGGRCTRGRRAKIICASAMTTGTGGDHTGLPCAVVYGLYALSPVNHPVCHRRPRDALGIIANLAPDLGAPGPHDFAVRVSAARQTAPSRPLHPRLTSRDDRDTPLRKRGGMRRRILLIYGNRNARPAASWHDGQIAHASHASHGRLEALSKAVGSNRRQIWLVAIYVRVRRHGRHG
jgi:hypothetical protein